MTPDHERGHRDVDRDRGVITRRDRQYLLGENEYNTQGERNVRMNIRDRAVEGTLDFVLLFETLPMRDLDLIGDALTTEQLEAAVEAFGFAHEYLGLKLEDAERRESILTDYRD